MPEQGTMYIGQELPTMSCKFVVNEICAEDHAYPNISHVHHANAHRPGFKYGADIGEIDGHPHLVVIDYYSFTVFQCPLPSLAMSSVITAFKTIFSKTGIPMTRHGQCLVFHQ